MLSLKKNKNKNNKTWKVSRKDRGMVVGNDTALSFSRNVGG